jgi:S-DNA-T family DNA segregation ATPase FtsK/SpoIIIE
VSSSPAGGASIRGASVRPARGDGLQPIPLHITHEAATRRARSTRAPSRSRPGSRRPARGRATPTRSRPSPARRRAPQNRHAPLLNADQRRELGGIAAIGAGLVLTAVLALPGGGSIAGPVHDALIGFLGAGAWLAAAGLVVAGVRILGRQGWTGGVLAAAGSVVTVVAVLGLLGLASTGGAGTVGRRVGPGMAQRLGSAGGGTVMVVVACLGLVLAADLRVARLAGAAMEWWRQRRKEAAEAAVQTPAAPLAGGLDETPMGGPFIEKMGRMGRRLEPETYRERAPFGTPELGLEPVEILLPGVEPDTSPPIAEPFQRQFEGLPVDDALAAAGEGGTEASPTPVPSPLPEEPEKVWDLPSIELLDTIQGKRERLEQEIRVTAATIVSTLSSFGIETRIRGVNSGPTVTQYELQPAKGVPVRKITAHQTDLALALAAPIRIQAPIPGKAAIGVEVPNKAAQLVTLREIVSAPAFPEVRSRLAVSLGADVSGHPVIGDLTRMPHMLIAGATGSGKSVCINAILGGFLLQATPAQLKLILIDPKRVELSNFADLPHLLVPVVVEPEAAVASLRWAVKEMEERYKLFASHGARNIIVFNDRTPQLGLHPLPYVVIVVDELADLMMVAAGEIEDLVCRIAQLARAVGIHLIVATQRPSADIVTGLIKANIPSRVAFAVSSGVDSRVILDEMGAERLLGRGDMLYLPIDEGKPRRLQGAFVSDRELERLIDFWKQQGLPDYQEEIFHVEATVSWARDAGKRDPLFAKAAHTVAAEGRAAASLLQRKLNVGYTRAARLVDQLAEHRVVGPFEGSKSRVVLMDVIQVDELLEELGEE